MDGVQVLGDRYRLVERLGTGGMSVVWRAYDEVLSRQVAVKVLAAKLAEDPESRQMIRAEAQAAARLSHPHVTGVYDYGESTTDDGSPVPYVVMELVDGRTLEDRLSRGPLPWRMALRLGAEVAAALAAAHARGLVHRDVKPANVMLTRSGAKVVDFGIAAVAGDTGEVRPGGIVLGTPAYLAPERMAGGPVRPATDVYALGVLLYRALTGTLPWQAETTTQMIKAHVYAEPSPLPPVPGLPDGVAELCLRCLAKDPEQRPTSRQVARTLAAAAGIRVPLHGDEPDKASEFDEADDAGEAVPAGPGQITSGAWRQMAAALYGPGAASADTAIVPKGAANRAAKQGRRRPGRRRATQVAGVAIGLAAVSLALTTCAADRKGQQGDVASRQGAPGGGVAQAPCSVRYLTRADNAGKVDVDLTVTNNTTQALPAWTLAFAFAGDQTLGATTAGVWTQSPTGAVTVHNVTGSPPLASKASTMMGFSADYHASNAMPTGFTLNDKVCSYVLVDAAGRTQTGGPQPATSAAPDGEAAAGTGTGGSGTTGGSGGTGLTGGQRNGDAAAGGGSTGNGSTGGGSTGGGVQGAPGGSGNGGGSNGGGSSGGGAAPPAAPPKKTKSPAPKPKPKPSPSDTGICLLVICIGVH
jgi:eukaryotic-like serine/threonine-protein kinase